MKSILGCLCILLFSIQISAAKDVEVEQLIKTTSSWNGVSLPDFADGETEVTMLKITIAPHTTLPEHFHPVINVAYMLRGELTVVSKKGEKKVIKSGDPLVELVNQDHYGINNGEEPVEILVVYFGEVGKPITVKR
jgi:quercetin dioxygenase-like cupin family protein